jgi:hypothetical protein
VPDLLRRLSLYLQKEYLPKRIENIVAVGNYVNAYENYIKAVSNYVNAN